jgi:uncharacterized iron-regulated membrane protein
MTNVKRSTFAASQPAQQRAAAPHWYNTVWRWHFYAGLFSIPFVTWLALTGTIYLWRPQIEALLDRPYDRLPIAGARFSPDAQVDAALKSVPGSTLHQYVLPEHASQAVRVIVSATGGDRRVYVDPYSLGILKVVQEDNRPLNVVSRLHGNLLAGAWGSYLVEIAACWATVMLLTGLYLWWPRRRKGLAGVLYPRLRGGRRLFWRDIHAVAGSWVSVFALGLILTGLPWASAWGTYLGEIREVTGTAQGPVDWTIGGRAPAKADPMLGPHAGHQGMALGAVPVRAGELSRVIATVRPLDLASPVLLAPPTHAGAPWTAASNTANRPRRVDVEIDGASGRMVGRVDFADRHWIDRLIGYGIAVHEGALFGIVNQLLGTATALLLVVLAVSGAVLWWRRRPTGLLGAPLPLTRPRFRTGLVVAIIALGVFMPLFGMTLLLVLAVEFVVLRRQPVLQRWLGLRAASA